MKGVRAEGARGGSKHLQGQPCTKHLTGVRQHASKKDLRAQQLPHCPSLRDTQLLKIGCLVPSVFDSLAHGCADLCCSAPQPQPLPCQESLNFHAPYHVMISMVIITALLHPPPPPLLRPAMVHDELPITSINHHACESMATLLVHRLASETGRKQPFYTCRTRAHCSIARQHNTSTRT